jgi:hypothetical protein
MKSIFSSLSILNLILFLMTVLLFTGCATSPNADRAVAEESSKPTKGAEHIAGFHSNRFSRNNNY